MPHAHTVICKFREGLKSEKKSPARHHGIHHTDLWDVKFPLVVGLRSSPLWSVEVGGPVCPPAPTVPSACLRAHREPLPGPGSCLSLSSLLLGVLGPWGLDSVPLTSARGQQTWPKGHIWPTACFCKLTFLGTQAHSFAFCPRLPALFCGRV